MSFSGWAARICSIVRYFSPPFQPELLTLAPAPIDSRLESLQPVNLELAHTTRLRRRVGQLLAQYHYRGFNGAVGENDVQSVGADADIDGGWFKLDG